MSPFSPYNAPPIPGTTGGLTRDYAPTSSPFFTVADQFLPRNLHDIIRWSRFITLKSPVTTEVIRKYSTYPITSLVTDTDSQELKDKYESVYRSFKLIESLQDAAFEYYTVGNAFLSIYYPIHRSLICPACRTVYNAKKAGFASFKKYKFMGACPNPACSHVGEFKIDDKRSMNVEDMNLIKWDPTHIAVNHNPITGESEYFYRIPNDIKRRIQTGDRLFVDSVPWSIVEAVKNNQDFKFDSDNLFHLKNISAGHAINGIAVPPLISLYGLVFYQQTLRKANESISTDFMNPLRVIYPTPQTANSDPVISISMRSFVSNMTEALIKHKKDRNNVLIAPVPVGYQAISGEGKNLLVSQEIQQAEETILLSLGVSRELLSGVTNWSSSTVGLRLLENTMLSLTSQMNRLIEWIVTKTSKYLGFQTCEVKLAPFKLTDDDALRNMLIEMFKNNQASPSTVFEAFGLDYQDELKNMSKDAIAKSVADVETGYAVEQAQFMASKNVTDKFDENSEYRNALTKAQGLTEQLMQIEDPAAKREMLGALKVQDYPMYLMVSSLLIEYSEQAQMQSQESIATSNAEKAQAEAETAANEGQEGNPVAAAGASISKPAAKPKRDSSTKTSDPKQVKKVTK